MPLSPYSNTGLDIAPYVAPPPPTVMDQPVRDAFPYVNTLATGPILGPSKVYIPTIDQAPQALTPNAKTTSFVSRIFG